MGIKVYRCDACYWRGYVREDRKGSPSIMNLSEETVETAWKICIIIVLALAGIAVLIRII
jgi:hypothetical protein